MKITPILASASLLIASVPAQTNFKSALHTFTNYGNYATQGTAVGFQTVLAKTKVVAGTGLAVSATVPAGGVDTIVGYNHRAGDVITVDVSEQGAASVGTTDRPFRGGSTPSPLVRGFAPGPHSLLLEIGGTAGASALLEFWATGVADRGVGVKYAYDVGNDGSVEFDYAPPDSATRILPVRIPRSGILQIKITSVVDVTVPSGGSVRYKTGASLRFTPGPHCAVLPYGRSCGPRLAGAFGPSTTRVGRFDLDYSNGSPHAPGLIVFGTTFQRIPLPGTDCVLLTDPRVVAGFMTDRNGAGSWSLLYQVGIVADIKIQGADLGGRRIPASNGLHVVCIQ